MMAKGFTRKRFMQSSNSVEILELNSSMLFIKLTGETFADNKLYSMGIGSTKFALCDTFYDSNKKIINLATYLTPSEYAIFLKMMFSIFSTPYLEPSFKYCIDLQAVAFCYLMEYKMMMSTDAEFMTLKQHLSSIIRINAFVYGNHLFEDSKVIDWVINPDQLNQYLCDHYNAFLEVPNLEPCVYDWMDNEVKIIPIDKTLEGNIITYNVHPLTMIEDFILGEAKVENLSSYYLNDFQRLVALQYLKGIQMNPGPVKSNNRVGQNV